MEQPVQATPSACGATGHPFHLADRTGTRSPTGRLVLLLCARARARVYEAMHILCMYLCMYICRYVESMHDV